MDLEILVVTWSKQKTSIDLYRVIFRCHQPTFECKISAVKSKQISCLFEQQNPSGIAHVHFMARNSLGLLVCALSLCLRVLVWFRWDLLIQDLQETAEITAVF